MTIDWTAPTDDVIEARRVGYEEGRQEMADEMAELLAKIVGLKEALGVF